MRKAISEYPGTEFTQDELSNITGITINSIRTILSPNRKTGGRNAHNLGLRMEYSQNNRKYIYRKI